ncbi:cytochrome P450 [Phytohabitans sp. ZYX-F-186]|uniref:Cytochrome P450 n=1 Tax=Phytohabitans maris TaxID=3071409 RepID=A0ABU0ZW63_9ACTN|nr:cytochrome P450 [Phytohabitans sp. ZYX-F-186]MDQ7911278.1 cytochrome P450 [Phytohabitans sp. ZYX-F-186]
MPSTVAGIVDSLLNDHPLALDDPYHLYAQVREREPVFRTERGLWVLSRYDDISRALRHRGMSMLAQLKANPRYATSPTLQTQAASMLFFDDPAEHARQRRLVSQAFNNVTVRDLSVWVRQHVTRLLDACLDKPAFDFMNDFAEHIPVAVICKMLGVPDRDIETFRDWNFLITSATAVNVPDEKMAKIEEATRNLLAYLDDLLADRARHPADDLITKLIQARDQDDRLSREETTALAFLLLVAGSDTTSAFLGAALAALLREPEQFALLRERPDLMPNAIEELMRLHGPVHFGLIRTTTEPLTVGDGVEIGVDQPVWTLLSGGNRDPRRFPEPDTMDLTRKDTRHLGFGFGMHTCLGAALGRMEASVALGELLRRTASISAVEETVSWVDHGNLRTIAALPVEVTPA